MTLRDFIRQHRAELDAAINNHLHPERYNDPPMPGEKLNDDERRQWILNDEGLYNWARSAGVKI